MIDLNGALERIAPFNWHFPIRIARLEFFLTGVGIATQFERAPSSQITTIFFSSEMLELVDRITQRFVF
jgi:hypothetical protein